jgi:hypothetical protein
VYRGGKIMTQTIHIYCDESCHLENDGMRAMVLGALWCRADHRKALARKIKALKAEHGLASGFEIKWVKVSPGKLPFYQALLDLFFDEPLLCFRGLVVPDKNALDHGRFGQSHNEFYYKQWYTLLNRLIDPERRCRIFLDTKVLFAQDGLLSAGAHHSQVREREGRMARNPERLKPRHIAVQGLRILLPHMADELFISIACGDLLVNKHAWLLLSSVAMVSKEPR